MRFDYGLAGELRKGRIKAKMTQTQIAKDLGFTSPQYISNVENGKCNPSDEYLAYATKHFKVNKQHLLNKILSMHRLHMESVLKI